MPRIKLKYGVVHYDYPPSKPEQPEPEQEIVPVYQERQTLFAALLTAFFTWLWFSDNK